MSKPVRALTAAAVSLVALSAGFSAAHAQPRPRFSTRLPSPVVTTAPAAEAPIVVQPAAPPIVEPEAPRAAPLGSVVAAELPVVATPQPVLNQSAPPSSSPPSSAMSTTTHLVGPGDTFYALARRYGVRPQAIADANGLTFGSTLRLGQRLALPPGAVDRGVGAAAVEPALVLRPAEAPVATPVSQPAPAAAESVATASPAVVEQPPTLSPPSPPVITAPRPVAPPAATPPVTAPPAVPREFAPLRPTPSFTPAPAPSSSPAAPSSAVASAVSAARNLAWPIRGEILAPFGPAGVGQRNDGLRIAAPEGASVRAAAAGRVVYAGDQVKGGYGKLVLVEHEGRLFTAYAHLSDIKVRMQDRVEQGQELGSVGRTGSVAAPQLYFEVRHAPTPDDRARPVDPMPLLPQ